MVFGLIATGASSPGQDLVLAVNSTNATVTAGASVGLWLNVMNTSRHVITWSFPESFEARISSPTMNFTNRLTIQSGDAVRDVTIAPGSFVRHEYALTMPVNVTGKVLLTFVALPLGDVVLNIAPPLDVAPPMRIQSRFSSILKDAEPIEAGKPFDPGRFFKEHISPYEPMYFLVGSESPSAKFQISFKYQLLNQGGWLAENAPALKGFNFAYTQTSLWDLGAPSAPFLDTSYKPALLYSWDRVVGGEETNAFRLDLQGGIQHESNGKNGADSRSLNVAFIRPTFVFGRNDRLQLTLQPRAWAYLGELNDNPDLDEYRGYFDLRAVLGWRRGLQLSALGRMGREGNHQSLQLDLTYPTMRFFGSFSVYLDAQYFTGYGESLLRYNEKSDSFRLGFSLYR